MLNYNVLPSKFSIITFSLSLSFYSEPFHILYIVWAFVVSSCILWSFVQNFKAKFPGSTDQWSNKQDILEEEVIDWIEPEQAYATKFGEGVFRNSPTETTTRRTTTTTGTTTTKPTTYSSTTTTTTNQWTDTTIENPGQKSSLQSMIYGNTNRPRESHPNSILDVLNISNDHSLRPPVFSVSLPSSFVGPPNKPRITTR